MPCGELAVGVLNNLGTPMDVEVHRIERKPIEHKSIDHTYIGHRYTVHTYVGHSIASMHIYGHKCIEPIKHQTWL